MSLPKFKLLSNGLKIIFIPHKVGSVTCCLRGLAGSNYENSGEVGASHVLEHLCTYGSINFSSTSDLRNIVLSKGGRVTGTTSRDDVAYLTKTLRENYEDGIKYLYEIFSNPILNQENLDKTKRVIKHEIYQNMENPQRHIGRISYRALYPNQRFSDYNTGSIADIEKLKLNSVIKFRNKHYSPSNFTLTICGDLNAEKVFKKAADYFEKIPSFDVSGALKHKPSYKRVFLVENRRNLKHLHLKIDYHGYKTDQKDKYGAYLLSKALKNRLKRELSLNNINPYILDASSFNSNSYGLFGVYTAIEPSQLETFFECYKKVMSNLCKEKIKREELDYLKNKTKADFEFALEKTSLKADFYSELYLYNNLTKNHEDEISNYLSCTSSMLLKVARDLLKQEPKITIIDKKVSENEVKRIYSKVFK